MLLAFYYYHFAKEKFGLLRSLPCGLSRPSYPLLVDLKEYMFYWCLVSGGGGWILASVDILSHTSYFIYQKKQQKINILYLRLDPNRKEGEREKKYSKNK